MCGIAGAVGPVPCATRERAAVMARTLVHRGPDDFGDWEARFESGGRPHAVAFGHTRLAVIDLSSRGRQPMSAADGSTTVVYNGEIYNFRALRDELRRRGHQFASGTDTEVVLAGYREWGTGVLQRLHGMFAFAVWDARTSTLLLARDRLGVKPLFFAHAGGGLLFASELRALRAHPAFAPRIDRGALGRFLRYGYVCGPETIYHDAFRLMPGELLTWRDGGLRRRSYWDLLAPPEEVPASFEDAVDELERRLRAAVAERLIADVPLGAFLSGGIDSTAVVALMREAASGPTRTFTIGYRGVDWDEAPHARAVARHLGTEHTELYVGRAEARDVVAELPSLYDEPFGDASAIPTVLVSRLAREHVTVALTGDGGDELFGGYSRYRRIRAFARLAPLPRPLRRLAAAAAGLAPDAPRSLRLAGSASVRDYADRITARADAAVAAACCGEEGGRPRAEYLRAFDGAPTAEAARRAMYADGRTYLADDILAKVDRAGMSVGLEARVPLLDHRVVRLALALPLATVWRGRATKSPLRALVYRRVPRELLERAKTGFGFPLASLLGPELASWRRHYLAPARLAEEGHLEPDGVARLLRSIDGGSADGKALWHLLCFQRWFARAHRGESDP